MDTKIVYIYIDGNGNKYVIESETIEYNPIKPTFSSSGIYDGGDYLKKNITNTQFNYVLTAINKGVSNQEKHIKDRVKLSGLITIKKGNTENTYILAPHSSEIRKIEKILKEIIKI